MKRKVQVVYGVKTKEDWVLLRKNQLVGKGEHSESDAKGMHFLGVLTRIGKMLGRSLARAARVMPVLAFLVAGGAVWQGASDSLPGDRLYPIKTTIEQVPLRFSAEERSLREFEIAKLRLADLKFVAEQNKVKNLPSAIEEFEANALKVSKDFLEIVENQPENALQASKQVVQLQKEKYEIEKMLGMKIGGDQEEEIASSIEERV